MAVTQSRTLPVVPLLNRSVLFPSLVLRLAIERRDISTLLSKLANSGNGHNLVVCIPQRQGATYSDSQTNVSLDELKTNLGQFGCLGKVLRVERGEDGMIAVIEGVHRIEVTSVRQMDDLPALEATVKHFDNKTISTDDTEAQRRLSSLKASSTELITTLKGLKLPAILIRRLEQFISKADSNSAGQLCDLMVSVVESSNADKIAVLECLDVSLRLKLVHELVSKQLNTIKVSRQISSTVDQNLNKQQKEYILRQKLNAIKKELGQLNGDKEDAESEEDDAAEYRKKIDAAQLSVEAKTVADKELKRLKRMQPQQAEYQVIRTYLDNILEIPWTRTSQDQNLAASSIDQAKRILDEDHFGLEKVKKRLIEYLAILRLRQTLERERQVDVKIDSKL
ncbi:putative LON domain serine protease [Taphrina deformans PYCC 5710]|uniref:LON domain serine protease n=1 Tax=Taphrina deformans (strain PYCC 5710 / ATCC 11124 / CBS 356.35 / IMI 108563 / JCM 9778 / NBRC 8474) TaxID=1097556 RepID=R4XF93_TAPDE|nr:putative LON domain serine protease [Taphrina deformans PYCC 5710]|eukprot:CCG82027.1 putative LON domain serine protease [Taphrina deformans PYCC 5710]